MLIGLLAWIATLYALLQISQLDVSWDHALCGPWGCGPPAQAVLAMHAGWFVLLGGFALILLQTARRCWLQKAAIAAVGTGLVAMLVIVGLDWWSYFPASASASNRFLWQRTLWSIAVAVDIPAIECTVLGAALWVLTLPSKRRAV